jgi:hypothetical protein
MSDIEVELPEEKTPYVENEDGSVDVTDLEAVPEISGEFLQNLAEVLDDSELNSLASDLVDLVEKDKESRKKRDEQYEEGLRRTGLGDDAPGGAEFDGASKVVHPVLAEACVDFSSRAIKELFPATGPVRRQQFDELTGPSVERADRKVKYMNWQLTTQMEEYRAELEQLLTQLPMGGSQFQKFWYDERFKRPRCEFVPVDEILLPFSSNCFYTAPRATHRQLITKYEFRERVESGLYRDIFISSPGSTPERSETSQANDKIEGREDNGYNEDGLRAILEIYTWQVIEGDELAGGAYVPYIITIDEDTEDVLAIYRNWAEGDPLFIKLDWFVEWKFIPWRGAYGIGLPHLIGGLSAALTGSLRALLDSAHINNAATMLKLRSGRVVGQNTQVDVTQICEIEGPASIDDIRKLAMPMPFNPPSPVLAQLMESMYALAKGVVATAEEKIGQVGDRTPVGTTMALIEQGSTTYSAIHARLHESQKKALSILHRIDATFPLAEGPVQVTQEDFIGPMDTIPVSDPSIFSEAQRFAQTQATVQMAQDQSVKWDKYKLYRRALKQMRVDNPDEILPPPPVPVSADPATENAAAVAGQQILAQMPQDHSAHVMGHLTYVSSPIQLQNPLIPAQALMGILNHIGQHIQMWEIMVTQQMAQKIQMSGAMLTPDQLSAAAIQQAQQALAPQVLPWLQQIAQLQAELQKRTPPPQLPPEVQATLQIAQAETQRKAQYDQGMLQVRQLEVQQSAQLDQAEMQQEQVRLLMDKQQAQFDQQLEAQRLMIESHSKSLENQLRAENERLKQQVELIKNEQDNHQKQVTDLIKNLQDNHTKEVIASGQAELELAGHLESSVEGINEAIDKMASTTAPQAIAEGMGNFTEGE